MLFTYDCPCGSSVRRAGPVYPPPRRQWCSSCGRRMRMIAVDWSADPISPGEVIGRGLAGGLGVQVGVAAEAGGAPFAGVTTGGGEGYVKSG